MKIKGCVTLVLAGGQGKRLGSLTRFYSKPAVYFGGKQRIIDFTLNNCNNSGIDTIGVLSQHFCIDLHAYIETTYDCRPERDGIYILPPRQNDYYTGTANAVYKNIGFIERFQPDCVLILASDHIYNMDYGKMIEFHRKTGADVTVSSTYSPIKESSRFGILKADESGQIYGFEEKPAHPQSNLVSMGIYVFKWDTLKKCLLADNANENSQHDFGENIIPKMLRDGKSMYRYRFEGYWQDVGTVDSLLEASMEQIDQQYTFNSMNSGLDADVRGISDMAYSSSGAEISQSAISDGCSVFGKVEHSVLGEQVTVGKGAEIIDSYVMPGAYIGNNAKIYNTIVGTGAIVMDHAVIGTDSGPDFFVDNMICKNGVSLVAPWLYVAGGMKFQAGSHIYEERLEELVACANIAYRSSVI